MNAQDLEQRARELLAQIRHLLASLPVDCLGSDTDASGQPYPIRDEVIHGITKLLAQQPAPVDLEQFREAVRAVDDFIFHRDRCGFPHQICDCGMKEARDRLLSIIELCPCGEATCTESWEPGCGLGESVKHAVPAEREPPRGDELRAILARQPAPVVDDAMVDAAIAAQDAHWANDANYPARAPRSVKGDAALHDKLARGAMRAALTAAIARAQGVQS